MKHRFLWWTGISAAVMLLLPWVVTRFVQSDAGFAVVLLLLFVVDPGYCLMAGYLAGKRMGQLWAVPPVSAALFLAGTWLCFEMGERAFVLYAVVYLLLGLTAMLLSHVWTKRRDQNG